MVYQLAKTSPLLTGQVKMNLILNGDTITDIQYTPISKHIKFNYANPVDVLNYSHMENIKMLYEKIADDFYRPIADPKLSTQHLYKFSDSIDDTHENTYEMGMKRCEYRRFNKQFEFFTPIWCDDVSDLQTLKFELVFEEPKTHKQIFKKFLKMTQEIETYITQTCWVSKEDENTNLIYIDFKKQESYTQGINVEKGIYETKDTSYILKTLLEQERPVLETDNMICNLFSANKLIVPQIFNFNIVFGIEDILPVTMLKSFIFEEGNAYINVYVGNELVEVKDFYTNYEYIPRYDIDAGAYSKSSNVLDYAQDYKCVQLLDKNKLVQSTIHWALRDNSESIFNLYNGFAPIYREYVSSKISCNEPDLFASMYDPIKNPFGIFKYTNMDGVGAAPNEFSKYIENGNNFYIYTQPFILDESVEELKKFGSLFINTKNVNLANLRLVCKKDKPIGSMPYDSTTSIELGISKVNKNLDLETLASYFGADMTKCLALVDFSRIGMLPVQFATTDKEIGGITVTDAKFFIIRSIGEIDDYSQDDNVIQNSTPELLVVEKYIYSGLHCLGRRIVIFVNALESKACRQLLTYETLSTVSISAYKQDENSHDSIVSLRNVFEFLQCFLTAIEKQQKIILDNSIEQRNAVAPSIYADEIEFNKSEKNIELYRYCSNLLPLFIDTNIDKDITEYKTQPWRNNVYWVKQYNNIDNFIGEKSSFGVRIKNEKALEYGGTGMTGRSGYIGSTGSSGGTGSSGSTGSTWDEITIGALSKSVNIDELVGKLSNDPDCIGDYIAEQNSDFLPLYPSIGYFPINGEQFDYKNFYLLKSEYQTKEYTYEKEISWYKSNSLLYLSEVFNVEIIIPANTKVRWSQIKNILCKKFRCLEQYPEHILKYIFNKYICTYKTDYVSVDDINQQKVKIQFTLK